MARKAGRSKDTTANLGFEAQRDNPTLKGVLPKEFGRPGLGFVQSEEFTEAHAGKLAGISIYDIEWSQTRV